MDKVTQDDFDYCLLVLRRNREPYISETFAALWSELQAHREHVCTDNSAVIARLEAELAEARRKLSGKLPCDVTVWPATTFRSGVEVAAVFRCIQRRREQLKEGDQGTADAAKVKDRA